MSNSPVRTACAVLALAALAGCGSSDDPTGPGNGQVRFVLSSAAAPVAAGAGADLGMIRGADGVLSPLHEDDRPQLQAANVTFTSFLARTLDGQLVPVSAALPATVDVIQVVEGKQVSLPVGFLPPGTYDQLVVVMSTVELVTEDGTTIEITPPGGGWTAIVNVAEPFDVVDGQTTTITLRFRWWGAFRWFEDRFEFHPAFDCEHD